MSQLYLQRFVYRGAVSRSEFDQAWAIALQTFAKSGNWGWSRDGRASPKELRNGLGRLRLK
jgi:hypothetical protein